MKLIIVLLLALAAAGAAAQPAWVTNLPGPPETCSADVINSIQWGTATSAYQVEGGWNADGKSPSVWDVFSQTPGRVVDNTTGNVACDMYHRWEEDIALMKRLGVKNYRMSIAWPRIVPQGVAGSPINMAGIRWYRNFILGLLQAGIKPAVTLYHWDLPQVLQEKYGGWLSPQSQHDYLYYADAVFKHLGDLVDQWMTFNEVISICELGYERDTFAPAVKGGLPAKYKCGHNVILAHAKAVQLYRTKYRPTQNGRVSIALDGKWGYAKDPKNPADVEAADYFMQFQYAWIADPLYFGDYPKIMRESQGDDLPNFTEAEKKLLKATTIDLFSVNFYCGYYVWAPGSGAPKNEVFKLGDPLTSPGIPSNAPWLFKTPDGLRNTLVWLNKRYNGPEFWVTENGVSGPGEESNGRAVAVRDDFRLDYYKTYLDNLCKAKTVDGVKITKYFAWSLLDNVEWAVGWTNRFGMVYVDLADNLSRHPKTSAYWFSKYFFTPTPKPTFTAKQRKAATMLPVVAAASSSTAGSLPRKFPAEPLTVTVGPAMKPIVKVAAAVGQPITAAGSTEAPGNTLHSTLGHGKGFALPLTVDVTDNALFGFHLHLGAKKK